MSILEFLLKYQILGAIGGSIITATVHLYNQNISFEEVTRRELRATLRQDINVLKVVDEQLKRNIQLLLRSKDALIPDIQFEEMKILNIDFDAVKDEKLKEALSNMHYYVSKAVSADNKVIAKTNMPREGFVVDYWGFKLDTEIDSELNKNIDQLYKKIGRINDSLQYVLGRVPLHAVVHTSTAYVIETTIKSIRDGLQELSQSNIQEIKDMVPREIARLERELSKITRR